MANKSKAAKLLDFPIVWVKWLDSCGNHAHQWERLSDLKKDLKDFGGDYLEHESVGFLISETNRSIVLAGSKKLNFTDEDDLVSDVMEIPSCAIIDRREIARPDSDA